MATKIELEEIRAVLRRVSAQQANSNIDLLNAVLDIEVATEGDDVLALQYIREAASVAATKLASS